MRANAHLPLACLITTRAYVYDQFTYAPCGRYAPQTSTRSQPQPQPHPREWCEELPGQRPLPLVPQQRQPQRQPDEAPPAEGLAQVLQGQRPPTLQQCRC